MNLNRGGFACSQRFVSATAEPDQRRPLGFTYDQATLRRKDRFRYPAQGWGLTHDGKQLLMSDGSSARH
jgi:Glutamine cyclotransferase